MLIVYVVFSFMHFGHFVAADRVVQAIPESHRGGGGQKSRAAGGAHRTLHGEPGYVLLHEAGIAPSPHVPVMWLNFCN